MFNEEMGRNSAKDTREIVVAPSTEYNNGAYSTEYDKNLKVRILDMSYDENAECEEDTNQGLAYNNKNIYYVDVYGIIAGFDTEVVFDEVVNDRLIYGKDKSTYFMQQAHQDRVEVAQYNFETLSYNDKNVANKYYNVVDIVDGKVQLQKLSRSGGKINFTGGVGKLVVTFGTEEDQKRAGVQTYEIPVCYPDRTISDLVFTASDAPNYVVYQNSRGEDTKGFLFDPFVLYAGGNMGIEEARDYFVQDYSNDEMILPNDVSVQGYLRKGTQSAKIKVSYGIFDEAFGSNSFYIEESGKYIYYDLQGKEDVSVYFDDSNVKMTVAGGEYVVRATMGNPREQQYIDYPVKVINKSVVSITDTIYSDSIKKAIKVYDYLNEVNVEERLIKDLFTNTKGTEFVVTLADGTELTYKYDIVAESTTNSTTGDDYIIQSEYKGGYSYPMRAFMDSGSSLRYNGGKVDFNITIPGYGMGSKGDQNAVVSFELEEQYIIYINPLKDYVTVANKRDNASTFSDFYANETYLDGDFSEQNAMLVEDELMHYEVLNPYHFISNGGLPLPEDIQVAVGSKQLKEEFDKLMASGRTQVEALAEAKEIVANSGVIIEPIVDEEYYDVSVLWSNSVNGRVKINFNDTKRTFAMSMPIDEQVYNLTFDITPWLFDNKTETIEAFKTTTKYGPDDVILLPKESAIGETNIVGQPNEFYIEVYFNTDDNNNAIYDTFYGYILHYNINGEEKTIYLNNIDGGGSSRDQYNKWYFDKVNFGSKNQYATMTLGGKGGQELSWLFTQTSTRECINSNVPNMLAGRAGDTINLPQNYIQTFSTLNSTKAEYTDVTSTYIPIEYSDVYKPVDDEELNISVNANLDAYQVTMNYFTPSNMQNLLFKMENSDGNEVFESNDYQVALLDWSIAGRRAYPSEDVKIGDTIILSGYGDFSPLYVPDNGNLLMNTVRDVVSAYVSSGSGRTTNNLYMPGTDEEIDGYVVNYINTGKPLDTGYEYPMSMQNTSGTYVTQNGVQNLLPTIKVKQGSVFNVHNLPLYQVHYVYGEKRLFLGMEDIAGIIQVGDIFDSYHINYGSTACMLPWQDATLYYANGDISFNNGVLTGVGEGITGNAFRHINTMAPKGTSYVLETSISLNYVNDEGNEENLYNNGFALHRKTENYQYATNRQTSTIFVRIDIV